jgi:hypothetical protein
MADAISSVGSAIATFLTQAIPPIAGASAELAFQPVGLPIDPDDFAGNALQAAAAVDNLADVTAKVVDGQYQPTLASATGLFELLLAGVVAAAGDTVTYGQLRNRAQEGYFGGSTDTLASPGDWWDPASAGWTSYTTSSSQDTGRGVIEPAPRIPWTWRVLPPSHQPVLAVPPAALFASFTAQPITRLLPPSGPPVSIDTDRGTGRVQSAVALAVEPPGAVAVAVEPAGAVAVAGEPAANAATTQAGLSATRGSWLASPQLLGLARGQLAGLASISSPAPVQADQLSVSFEYATVALNRPWWDALLVDNTDWYLPGYAAGDLAPGSLAGTGGLCGGLPTGMVLIRNLAISGSWTASDQTALAGASTFGPFSLFGRTIAPDLTIEVLGTQLVAWVVTELPLLPPLGDPNISPATVPDPLTGLPVLAAGAAGPFVSRAQALLGVLLPSATPGPQVTGTFDAATAQAVEAFQNAAHVAATGVIDLPTWHQLLGL